MGFFGRGGGQDDGQQSEELARIEGGGIPSGAEELGAKGSVGVSLSERSHGWGSHVIEFFALGTAIVRTEEGAKIEPPVTVVDMNDPRS